MTKKPSKKQAAVSAKKAAKPRSKRAIAAKRAAVVAKTTAAPVSADIRRDYFRTLLKKYM